MPSTGAFNGVTPTPSADNVGVIPNPAISLEANDVQEAVEENAAELHQLNNAQSFAGLWENAIT